jgi:hypothetical protein
MCVIIVRDPGIEIPFAKIESACHVNSDGFGIVIADRGKQEIIKEFNPQGNDPARVARLLEQAKDNPLALHLRFATAGEKSSMNCHPFSTLTQADHGLDVQFMHNGTLSAFTDSKSVMSDSYHFNEKVVRPLLIRSAAFLGTELCLTDPFVFEVLDKYRGASKFVLFDDKGKSLIIGEADGKQFEGWWASNDYSFDRTHREPWEPTHYKSSYWRGSSGPYGPSSSKAVTVYPPAGSKSSPKEESENYEAEALSAVFAALKHDGANYVEVEPPQERESFVSHCGLDSLEEVCRLEPDDIAEMVENYPEMTKTLIMDLLYELYLRTSEDQETH